MDFPYEFFKAEIIEDTLVSETMKKAWASSLETLSDVVAAIDKRHLRWCALYGTLLGAVRHKGFIPWDDDIDIGMPRKDYDIFRKTCFEDLPEGYNVIDPGEEETRGLDILRINNTLDLRGDEEFLRKFHGCPYIIGIDVYPIDNVSDDDEMDGGICDALNLISRVLTIDMDLENATMDDYAERGEILGILEDNLHCSLDNEETLHVDLMKQFDRLCAAYKNVKTKNVTVFRNHRSLPHQVFPRELFNSFIDAEFENMTVKIPKDYDAVLRIMFGDYNTPVKFGTEAHEYGFENQQRFVYDTLGYIL